MPEAQRFANLGIRSGTETRRRYYRSGVCTVIHGNYKEILAYCDHIKILIVTPENSGKITVLTLYIVDFIVVLLVILLEKFGMGTE